MTYATLMVNLQLGRANAGLLQIAADLAERFQSRVVGIAAGEAVEVVYDEGRMSGDVIEQDLVRLDREIGLLEAEFRAAVHGRNREVLWRSRKMFGPVDDYLAAEARCADLIVTGVDRDEADLSPRQVDTAGVVLQAGRPVLVVPAAAGCMNLQRVVVCWKDTKEARRAVSDALPILKSAAHVEVVEIAAERDLESSRVRLDDVVGWLSQHGVCARPSAIPSYGDDKAELASIFDDRRADVVVAGAYGHSRLREWVLGGVSRDLLVHADRCSMVSH